MTDFFASLIEISRKTQKEARIKFKGLGTLHLFKNRELAFLFEDDSIELKTITGSRVSNDLFLERQKEREDLSFIDSASAVLSMGGGNTFSIKSSALRSLSHAGSIPSRVSKDTRSARYSTSSSITHGQRSKQMLNPLKKDLVWKRYLRKNAEQARARADAVSTKSKSLSVHSINNAYNTMNVGSSVGGVYKERQVPASMNLNTHTNAPTMVMGLSSPDGVYKEKGVSQVPYPFLSALVDRKNFNRFSKRVVFDRSDYDDHLNQIVDQIHEKKQREMDERIVEKDDEQRQLAFQRDMLLLEKEDERQDKENKRLAFV